MCQVEGKSIVKHQDAQPTHILSMYILRIHQETRKFVFQPDYCLTIILRIVLKIEIHFSAFKIGVKYDILGTTFLAIQK